MSNSFTCPKCGVEIVETPEGYYTTGCPHYPIEHRTRVHYEPNLKRPPEGLDSVPDEDYEDDYAWMYRLG